jgi:hypothetical protein
MAGQIATLVRDGLAASVMLATIEIRGNRRPAKTRQLGEQRAEMRGGGAALDKECALASVHGAEHGAVGALVGREPVDVPADVLEPRVGHVRAAPAAHAGQSARSTGFSTAYPSFEPLPPVGVNRAARMSRL